MDDLDLIKEKINIVDLIQEYLPLKKAGVNFKAPCPFHEERTPSFVVSPERGIWHCFGCDKGGDIFKFIMEKEGMGFTDALELLAQKAGITLKKTRKESEVNSRLYEANSKTAQFYNYLLTEHNLGKKALGYLHKRGLTDETIKLFNLGYAPASWESLSHFLKTRHFTDSELINAGLAVPSKNRSYDRFRGRVMFPLVDVRSRVIGFAGRILDKGEPKYINTPQTPVFDKGRLLFGLNLSKSEIKQKKEAILVEGEMDMITSYQAGVKHVVASKGTALTEFQTDLLKKYTDTLLLCFDSDLAGDAAMRRGMEIAQKSGLNIKIIKMEGGKDPGDIASKDPEAWKVMAENAIPIYDFYLQSVERRFNLKSAMDKKVLFAEVLPIWSKITDSLEREHYIQKLAALLQVKDEVIRDQLDSYQKEKKNQPTYATPVMPTRPVIPGNEHELKNRRELLEEYLISLLLHLPVEHTYVPHFPETLFTKEPLRQTYVMIVIYLDSISFKGQAFKISEFIKTIPPDLVETVDRLFLTQLDEKLEESKHWQKELDLVIAQLKKMLIHASLEKLSLQIKNAQSFEKVDALSSLNKRFRDLSTKLKNM